MDGTQPAGPIADFVEPGFPFITSTVDARQAGPSLPDDNVATRGVVLMLGDSTYAVFDPDLMRMAVGWRGEFLPMTTMAQVSYQDSLNKNNQIPRVLGRPLFATGVYPGWVVEGQQPFSDPRRPGPNPDDPGRGPLPAEQARWQGVYVVGDRAVLAYTVGDTEVRELPGSVRSGSQVGIVRTIQTGPIQKRLGLVAAEVRGATGSSLDGNRATFAEAGGDTVTVVAAVDAPEGAVMGVTGDRYAVLLLPAGASSALFRVVHWRGPAAELPAFEAMLAGETEMIAFDEGGPTHWPEVVETHGEIAPDSAAYVVDEVLLPLGNPWRRNVRPSDLAFFQDGRAAVTTFEGDVWIVDGLEGDLEEIEWKRFASGLYEPMSVEIVDDEIYVYSRSGLTRPRDLNRDGEADYYENFSDLSVQTLESREFPLSMGKKPGGGFYLSRGGALDNGPRTSRAIMPGFRAGSAQSGTVMELSADGRSIRTFASGLREPFIAVHPDGRITSSDQQGNFVPSTPVYRIVEGGYYGVPATAHGEGKDRIEPALAWIPHEVDQSGAGQVWVPGGEMGFREDALIHISYGRPGAFRVYFDEAAGGVQGAVVSLSDDFAAPILKGEFSPEDEQLYLAGFQIWGTRSGGIRTLARLRYTGRPSLLPEGISAGEQGLIVRFGVPLDPATATDVSRYSLSRWNYQRTQQYGSGHFKLDGSAGEERLPVASAHLSEDRRTLLLVVPDMREVMQMQVAWDFQAASGEAMIDTLYVTLNQAEPLDLAAAGFGGVDWRGSIATAGGVQAPSAEAASAAAGEALYQRIGCVACHSVDGTTAGKLGPTFRGLFGSLRPLADGTSVRADAAYLRRSIEQPGAEIAQGYQEGMPAYLGVLSDAEVESLVLYIQSLGN